MILVCAIHTAHCLIYSSAITICTLHPYACFSLLLYTYNHWCWVPYRKAETSDSVRWFSMLMLSLQFFLALYAGEIPIFDLWGVGSCAPYGCSKSRRRDVCDCHYNYSCLWVFGTVIPTFSFNFCYCSFSLIHGILW